MTYTGNTATVLQDNQALALAGNHLKRIDYNFDLLSGATHQVNYRMHSTAARDSSRALDRLGHWGDAFQMGG